MILSRYTLKNIQPDVVTVPDEDLFELPEKVLQFGTGVFLRGLPDYFIDKANRKGIFNGRIVVVKSTLPGDTSEFDKQDGLYTVCVRGVTDGVTTEENVINSAISRVLSANEEWGQVLECAHNQHLQIIISNSTETGIQLVNDDVRHYPPKSFPGKLLAFLYERYNAFGGSEKSGMVIVPTELIPDNGTKLESIVLELAHLNGLEDAFIEWLESCNHFCNSVVDAIVPGKPNGEKYKTLEGQLGYTDNLLIITEPFRLWAIEGNGQIHDILSFAAADAGVIIAEDISLLRELKVGLLNGTLAMSAGLAYLAGCNSVRQAMEDATLSSFIVDMMKHDIAPFLQAHFEDCVIETYTEAVLNRFRNPELEYLWHSVALNYSSKMKMWFVPLLVKHYQAGKSVPESLALSFAAYIYFAKPVLKKSGCYYGERNDTLYEIKDEKAEVFYKRWNNLSLAGLVNDVLIDAGYWGEDLSSLPGFKKAVLDKLDLLLKNDIKAVVRGLRTKNGSVTEAAAYKPLV